jgi:hypothetical protein
VLNPGTEGALAIFVGGVLVSIGAFGWVWGLADDMRKILGVHRRGVQTTATGVGHRTNSSADQDTSETYSPIVSFTTMAGERISDVVLRDADKDDPPERGRTYTVYYDREAPTVVSVRRRNVRGLLIRFIFTPPLIVAGCFFLVWAVIAAARLAGFHLLPPDLDREHFIEPPWQ